MNRNIHLLIGRLLLSVTATVHTSAGTLLDATCDLTLHPEVQEELKDEIETVFRQSGQWSKQALSKMIKLDSYMRERA